MGYKTPLAQAIKALKENPDCQDKASVTKRDYNRYRAEVLNFLGPNKIFSGISCMNWQAFQRLLPSPYRWKSASL